MENFGIFSHTHTHIFWPKQKKKKFYTLNKPIAIIIIITGLEFLFLSNFVGKKLLYCLFLKQFFVFQNRNSSYVFWLKKSPQNDNNNNNTISHMAVIIVVVVGIDFCLFENESFLQE